MLFKKQNPKETSTSSNSEPPEKRAEKRAIDEISFDGEDFVFEGEAQPQANDNDDPIRSKIRSTIVDLYPPEKFHKTFCSVCSWTGDRYGLQSLAVEHDDDALQAATEVVHRLLVARLGHRVLARMDSQTAKDVLVIMFGFGPLVTGVAKEIAAKRKTKNLPIVAENDGADDGQERA